MSSNIRVAMIIQNYHPLVGGAERQLAALAPLLQAQGVDVHVLTRRYSNLAPFEMIDNVPVHRLPIIQSKAIASFMFTLAALPLLKRLRPHVIHAHGLLSPTTTAVAAKRIFGSPVVSKSLRGGTLGDLDRLKRKPFGMRRISTFRQRVDAFVTISHEINTELVEVGIPAERCHFIPNGVDLNRFSPPSPAQKQTLRAMLGLSNGPIVISTCRLEPEKRVAQLIGIWPAIRAAHPDASLLILGTGTEETKLKQQAGVGIQFLGRVEDVVPYLQASDLFVLPSATEGLPNALLEALAIGLPAIATAVGGTPDVINHQETGWLIPADSPSVLQEATLTLLGNAGYRDKLGQQGLERVVEGYTLPMTANRLCALYEKLLQVKSGKMEHQVEQE